MRVMYVASNPANEAGLRLEQDITELQRAVSQSSGPRVDFNPLPALPFEDLEQQVAAYKPDILHISAHGSKSKITLATSKETAVPLTANTLRPLLASHPPRVLLISACTSLGIAEEIVDTVPYAIGLSAAATNLAARKSAVALYRSLLRGESLHSAFEKCDATVSALSNGKVSARIFEAHGVNSKRESLYNLPRLVAYLPKHSFPKTTKTFSFNIGIWGAYPETIQVAFVTDDESFLNTSGDPHDDMWSIVRSTPVSGEVWQTEDQWIVSGDFRIFALASTADGRCYNVVGTLCEALRTFYDIYFGPERYPDSLTRILRILRENDGAMMRPKVVAGEDAASHRVSRMSRRRKRRRR